MLITLIVSLLIIGVLLYIVRVLIPVDPRIMSIIYLLIGVYIVLWILAALGINVPILGPLVRNP